MGIEPQPGEAEGNGQEIAASGLLECRRRCEQARGSQPDIGEAQAAIERLEGLPVNFRWAVRDITVLRLRTLLAETRGDERLEFRARKPK